MKINNITGRILYEYADTVLTHQHRKYSEGQLSPEEFQRDLEFSIAKAIESTNCLQFDEPGTFESHIYQCSMNLVSQAQNFLDQMNAYK